VPVDAPKAQLRTTAEPERLWHLLVGAGVRGSYSGPRLLVRFWSERPSHSSVRYARLLLRCIEKKGSSNRSYALRVSGIGKCSEQAAPERALI